MIISDSMAKYVADIKDTDIRCFPGMTTGQLTTKIDNGCFDLNYANILIHVGTNDVNKYTCGEISSLFSNLVSVLKTNTDRNTSLYISSILPRPVDFTTTGSKVKEINVTLEALCKKRKVSFMRSFRPFLKANHPCRDLYAIKDGGLHLNLDGTRRLRQFFCKYNSTYVK